MGGEVRIVPSGFPLYDAARDKFLAVLDWTDDAGRSLTFGWTGTRITSVSDSSSPPRTPDGAPR